MKKELHKEIRTCVTAELRDSISKLKDIAARIEPDEKPLQ
jgi:hypothetical protein